MRYIVGAPTYDDNNGGSIFLHALAGVLRELGEDALLWPLPRVYKPSKMGRLRTMLKPDEFRTNSELDVPLFSGRRARADDVVVYPEITRRNPLRAQNVVRWLLYRPGALHPFEFGQDDMFFKAAEFCDMPELTGGAPDLYVWRRNRTYRNEERPGRDGVCYMVRKGFDKPRIPETEDGEAIRIDKLPHAETNDIFNRCKTFISYDEATMYSQFAAICGCDSIVVPGMFASQQEWIANHSMGRYGVAYGFENLPHARATRDKVLDMLDQKEAESIETVRNFVNLTRQHFNL